MNIPRPLFAGAAAVRLRAVLRWLTPVTILAAGFLIAPGDGLARGWMGVSVQDIDPSLREAMDLSSAGGALVTDVAPGGPAARAGVRARDVILRVDDSPVEDSEDLIAALAQKGPGDAITLSILRGRNPLELRVLLSSRSSTEATPERIPPSDPLKGPKTSLRIPRMLREGPMLGVTVHSLDPDLARYFKAEAGHGVLILSVTPKSPAASAGFVPGDVLLTFNGNPVSDTASLKQEVEQLRAGDVWSAVGIRDGREREFRGRMGRIRVLPFCAAPLRGRVRTETTVRTGLSSCVGKFGASSGRWRSSGKGSAGSSAGSARKRIASPRLPLRINGSGPGSSSPGPSRAPEITPRPRGPSTATKALDEIPGRNNPEAQGLIWCIDRLKSKLNRSD